MSLSWRSSAFPRRRYIEILENLKGRKIKLPIDDIDQHPSGPVVRDHGQRRAVPRCYLVVNRSISDVDDPGVKGILVDISARGLQIAGIPARVGDVKTFVVGNDTFNPDSELRFEAVCRWFQPGDATGDCVAGYEIGRISEKGRNRLQRLLQEFTFCETGFQ